MVSGADVSDRLVGGMCIKDTACCEEEGWATEVRHSVEPGTGVKDTPDSDVYGLLAMMTGSSDVGMVKATDFAASDLGVEDISLFTLDMTEVTTICDIACNKGAEARGGAGRMFA